ncbi:MAG: NAD(P)H-dependent oxidoreductase [Alphaproteobacteria bacterium]|nr:NAD(P)H-dependent oxidoreductase [Alphaproteobacteria bacterium]
MAQLLILYDSLTGGAEAMAQAAAQGAQSAEPGLRVHLCRAADALPTDILAADGVLFACPENLAAMSGVMKAFFDRAYYAVLGKIEGRPYALMVCAGSDGENAARQMSRIATGWRMKPVADPLIICTHAQSPEEILAPKHLPEKDLAPCRALGATLAAGLILGIF